MRLSSSQYQERNHCKYVDGKSTEGGKRDHLCGFAGEQYDYPHEHVEGERIGWRLPRVVQARKGVVQVLRSPEFHRCTARDEEYSVKRSH